MLALLFLGGSVLAQTSNSNETPSKREVQNPNDKVKENKSFRSFNGGHGNPENTILWSEDFTNGIPAGWGNGGTANGFPDPDAKWEYRGPTGAFPATTGSRGAYTPSTSVLTSPTGSTGFVIIDSDFLDNAGIGGNFGAGIAPAPHLITLTTSVIDLSANSSLFLNFHQYYRRFAGPGGSQAVPATYVDFSTDGGLTWPGSVTVNSIVPVNGSTTTNDLQSINVSAFIGGSANARIRFRFDGDYYFWMLDDISLSTPNLVDLQFVSVNGVQPTDFIIGDGSQMGITTPVQSKDWSFLASVANQGTAAITGVQLQVGIMKNSVPYATVMSPIFDTIASGAILDFNLLNTFADPFTPTEIDSYQYYSRVVSNEITLASDTSWFFVTPSLLSLDFNAYWNDIGTAQLGNQNSGLAVRLDLEADDFLYGIQLGIGNSTVAGGQVQISIYDSAAFTGYVTGFDPAGRLDSLAPHTITVEEDTTGVLYLPFNSPIFANSAHRSVFVEVRMFANGGVNPIAIKNDQTVNPNFWAGSVGSAIMFLSANNRWYTGYSSSRTFASPWIRAISDNFNVCDFVSVDSVAKISSPAQYEINYTAPHAERYVLQLKATEDSVWTTPKSWTDTSLTSQLVNLRTPGTSTDVRIGALYEGQWMYSCGFTFTPDCKPMSVNAIELVAPFCVGDSALLKGIANGGFKSKTFLWSTGETTRFIYGQQGMSYTFVATDQNGCQDSASVTASDLSINSMAPSNFAVAKTSQVNFVGTWDPVTLGTGVSLLGYRMAYRQAGIGASWITTSLSASTTASVDFTGTGFVSANYEFTAFARINDNGTARNTGFACIGRKFYNGSGLKNDGSFNGDAEGFSVYPNPSSSFINLSGNNVESLVIMNTLGQRVLDIQNPSNGMSIDISNLANGAYLITVIQNGETKTERLIKN